MKAQKIQMRFAGVKEKPYAKVCCWACWNAKGKKCVCRCGGLYHGLGHEDLKQHEEEILIREPRKILDKIKNHVCRFCASMMEPEIYGYPHSAGWKVTGYDSLLWLYMKCERCGYAWSIDKLGVSRTEEF